MRPSTRPSSLRWGCAICNGEVCVGSFWLQYVKRYYSNQRFAFNVDLRLYAKDIPVVPLTPADAADAGKLAGGENCIKVIAGDAAQFGQKGAASVHTPVELLDIRMAGPDVASPFHLNLNV